MNCGVGGVNQEVIHVDDEPSFGLVVLKNMIHQRLECRRGVAQSKEHYVRFEESMRSDERCLPVVIGFDLNIVVPPSDVKFRKNLRPFQVVDQWKGIRIFYSMRVQISVVLAWMKRSVFLWNKEEGRSLRRFGRGDLARLQMFFDEFLARI
ncbi:hypothetical protein PAXRUDRAFT_166624 [Paxillus rubicundulus Ve08.2h10]|uniref:Uncharacterized protein n=1 Tax=Paxillus rubicundulus Ve08.2h10 TaxID=930991 RepID=A0A0D0DAI1_9AGAM|nr:hypothetical protein PAXRUDRAFT_166624 [Paxillus rubicundulus Ve08.2h10]